MLVKSGVDISRLKRAIRRSLCPVDKIFKKHKYQLVITSTYEGNHCACSYHYGNDAYDIRWHPKRDKNVINEIKSALGPDFFVLDERNHLHIHFVPRNKQGGK